MLEPRRNRSTNRYPTGKLLPAALPKGRSYSTFYSRGKEGRLEGEGQIDSKVRSIKDFIDVYFEEEVKSASHRMPVIRRRSQLFDSGKVAERKGKGIPQADEDLSKSVAYDNAVSGPDSFLPMTSLRWSVSAMEQQLPSIHEQTEGGQD
jgi:hypothetical protein